MIITGAKDPNSDDPTKEAFSSGGYFNLEALKEIPEELMKQIDFDDIAQKKLTLKMFNCDKPILAAVNGLVIGGAFTMALSGADLIYLSEHAWIRMPFNALGLVAELASSFLLPRLIGFQKAKEIVYFSKKITAKEALDLGLINDVLPHDSLLQHTREAALKLIPPKGAGLAIRKMKRLFHKHHIEAVTKALDSENEDLRVGFKTADFAEAIAARIEKREPVFQGK